jgi:hypothetical protein
MYFYILYRTCTCTYIFIRHGTQYVRGCQHTLVLWYLDTYKYVHTPHTIWYDLIYSRYSSYRYQYFQLGIYTKLWNPTYLFRHRGNQYERDDIQYNIGRHPHPRELFYSSDNISIPRYPKVLSWTIILLGQYLDTSIHVECRYVPVPWYLDSNTLCTIWSKLQFFKCRYRYCNIRSYPAVSSWPTRTLMH